MGSIFVSIKDGSDCSRMKRRGGNKKCLFQIKYMHNIKNTEEIDYSLNILLSYFKQYIILFVIKESGAKSIAIFISFRHTIRGTQFQPKVSL